MDTNAVTDSVATSTNKIDVSQQTNPGASSSTAKDAYIKAMQKLVHDVRRDNKPASYIDTVSSPIPDSKSPAQKGGALDALSSKTSQGNGGEIVTNTYQIPKGKDAVITLKPTQHVPQYFIVRDQIGAVIGSATAAGLNQPVEIKIERPISGKITVEVGPGTIQVNPSNYGTATASGHSINVGQWRAALDVVAKDQEKK